MKHIPRKRFGQNFLTDTTVITRILNAIHPTAEDHLVEIGPGLGALTQKLIHAAERLDAIEIDRDLAQHLQTLYQSCSNFQLHNIDALTCSLTTLKTAEKSEKKLRIVGNLPYNISTPLLFHLFEEIHHIKDMHFMLQQEVVNRMIAHAGDSEYGRLSIMSQYFCEVEKLFTVPPEAFDPAPKVYSAVVRLVPHPQKVFNLQEYEVLSNIVKQAFMHRRKTIANNLKQFINVANLEQINIAPTKRPQELSLADYVAITKIL